MPRPETSTVALSQSQPGHDANFGRLSQFPPEPNSVDVLTPDQRNLNMRRIRGKDTKPELLLRRGLHLAGLRFRLHSTKLVGRPDLIFPRYGAVVLVHGCFWHGHDCPLFKLPATRPAFWHLKIRQNQMRDQSVVKSLIADGWRVLTVWECAVKGPRRFKSEQHIIDRCISFIKGKAVRGTIAGKPVQKRRWTSSTP